MALRKISFKKFSIDGAPENKFQKFSIDGARKKSELKINFGRWRSEIGLDKTSIDGAPKKCQIPSSQKVSKKVRKKFGKVLGKRLDSHIPNPEQTIAWMFHPEYPDISQLDDELFTPNI